MDIFCLMDIPQCMAGHVFYLCLRSVWLHLSIDTSTNKKENGQDVCVIIMLVIPQCTVEAHPPAEFMNPLSAPVERYVYIFIAIVFLGSPEFFMFYVYVRVCLLFAWLQASVVIFVHI